MIGMKLCDVLSKHTVLKLHDLWFLKKIYICEMTFPQSLSSSQRSSTINAVRKSSFKFDLVVNGGNGSWLYYLLQHFYNIPDAIIIHFPIIYPDIWFLWKLWDLYWDLKQLCGSAQRLSQHVRLMSPPAGPAGLRRLMNKSWSISQCSW